MASITALHANYATEHQLAHDRVPSHHRRLSDKVLIVFHHACDALDVEAAEHIFAVLERMASGHPRTGGVDRRIDAHVLTGARNRLREIREVARSRLGEGRLPDPTS